MMRFLLVALVACRSDGDAIVERFPHGGTAASPLVVALHGMGGSPEGIAPLFDDFPVAAEIALPRGLVIRDDGWAWFPWDSTTTDAQLAQAIADADAKLWPEIVAHAHGRPIIVTGFSQGGMMAYALAARHPAEIVAAFPISGWLPRALWPRAKAAPVYALHGDSDDVIPVEYARATVAAFRAAGGTAELHELPGVAHRWWPMRDDVIAHLRAAVMH